MCIATDSDRNSFDKKERINSETELCIPNPVDLKKFLKYLTGMSELPSNVLSNRNQMEDSDPYNIAVETAERILYSPPPYEDNHESLYDKILKMVGESTTSDNDVLEQFGNVGPANKSLDSEFEKVPRRFDDHGLKPQISYVKNVDWSKQNQRRCGVIVYFTWNDKIIFNMGYDTVYQEITDFGGHKEPEDTDPICTALREFKEETLGVYGDISINSVSECLVVHDADMLILFLPLEFDPKTINSDFEKMLILQESPEINKLAWLSRETFISLIGNRKFKSHDSWRSGYKNRKRSKTLGVDKIRSKRITDSNINDPVMYEKVRCFLSGVCNEFINLL